MPAEKLWTHHLTDLQGSGLSADTIAKSGCYSATERTVRELLGFGVGPGLVFPYPGCTTPAGGVFCQVKPDTKPAFLNGAKYLTPKGAGCRVYFPPTLDPGLLKDATQPLYITEGVKKALKACQEGLPCLALAGVDAWKDHLGGKSAPIPDLDRIVWKNRTVVIVYDSDLADKLAVRFAEFRLARELRSRGAQVSAVRLPGGPTGAKVGLDDFLLDHTVDAFHVLEPIQIHHPARDGLFAGPKAPTLIPFGEAMREWQHSCDETPEPRIPTPFPALTQKLDGGWGPGELYYVGARPGVGKSSMALEVARHAAEQGTGVLFISREMIARALVRRVIAQKVRIPARSLKRGLLTEEQWAQYAHDYEALLGLPIWLTESIETLQQIDQAVGTWKNPTRLGLVIVDYLQLIRGTKRDRRHEVEEVSAGLKNVAFRHRVAMLCCCSLARLGKDQPNRRPILSDLRESGQIEHDADVAMFLWRESESSTETECIIRKQRDGPTGTVHLRFLPAYVALEQAADQDPGEE